MSLKLPIHATVSSPGGHRSYTRIGGPVSHLVNYYQVGTRSRLCGAFEALTLPAASGGSLSPVQTRQRKPHAVEGQHPAQAQPGSLVGCGGCVGWPLPLESPHPCRKLRSLNRSFAISREVTPSACHPARSKASME